MQHINYQQGSLFLHILFLEFIIINPKGCFLKKNIDKEVVAEVPCGSLPRNWNIPGGYKKQGFEIRGDGGIINGL
jgi:hypothetical protein